jgi:hypothetical protein
VYVLLPNKTNQNRQFSVCLVSITLLETDAIRISLFSVLTFKEFLPRIWSQSEVDGIRHPDPVALLIERVGTQM